MRRGWAVLLGAALLLASALPAVAAEAGLLVDPTWLHAHLKDANLRIVDMVTEPEAYQKAHVPGAVYCQTHHRAAHSYFVLRLLGYSRVVGYDHSWIEWGNRDDLPIAK